MSEECDGLVELAAVFSKVLEVEISPEKAKTLVAMMKILEASGQEGLKRVLEDLKNEEVGTL